jgi:5-methylcytosine-specific restriction endonuclease McrA
MRFTKKDKKLIAEAQHQVRVYEDDWDGTYEVVYVCKRCRQEFTRLDDLEVDHIRPRSRRGTDNPSNLQLLCTRCNRLKGSKVKGESTTVKRKTSTVKRKSNTAKRNSSTAVKRKTSTAQKKRR